MTKEELLANDELPNMIGGAIRHYNLYRYIKQLNVDISDFIHEVYVDIFINDISTKISKTTNAYNHTLWTAHRLLVNEKKNKLITNMPQEKIILDFFEGFERNEELNKKIFAKVTYIIC